VLQPVNLLPVTINNLFSKRKKKIEKIMIQHVPPPGFSAVKTGLYRSSYPNKRTYSFIHTLKLKSLICLQPEDLRDDLRKFCESNEINLITIDVGVNREPFLQMDNIAISNAIEFATGKQSIITYKSDKK
jgi:hypothetical protein